MGEIVNLRHARKAKAKAAATAAAAANRALNGRTPTERDQQRLEEEQARRKLDGAKQEP